MVVYKHEEDTITCYIYTRYVVTTLKYQEQNYNQLSSKRV